MIYKIINVIDKIRPFKKVSAHCDIPCKIYDPITSQIAVLTMIRLVDLIEEIEKKRFFNFQRSRSNFPTYSSKRGTWS